MFVAIAALAFLLDGACKAKDDIAAGAALTWLSVDGHYGVADAAKNHGHESVCLFDLSIVDAFVLA